jgi:hypothetical protein
MDDMASSQSIILIFTSSIAGPAAAAGAAAGVTEGDITVFGVVESLDEDISLADGTAILVSLILSCCMAEAAVMASSSLSIAINVDICTQNARLAINKI